jgi:SAM-dependent methyltransferase
MPDTLYSKEYFLTDCEGFVQFNSSKGRALSPRLKKIFNLAEITENMSVLDVGSGRGELVLHSAEKCAQAIGIDFSKDAIALSEESLNNWSKKNPKIKDKVKFIKGDCTCAVFAPETFDKIFLSDIIEHLEPEKFEAALDILAKTLKPNGKIIFHTSPNSIFLRYGLKIYNLIGRLYGKKLPWDMVKQLPVGLQKDFHVNCQTAYSLKKVFRSKGFRDIKIWLEKNPKYIYHFFQDDSFVKKINAFYKLLPIKHLFLSDIYGIAQK